MKSGPIIVVEDDIDDKEVLEGILKELDVTNKLIWFSQPGDAFDYLKTTSEQPFIIISDVNLLYSILLPSIKKRLLKPSRN